MPLPALPEAILGGTVTGLGFDHAGSVIVLAAEGCWLEAPIGFGASQPYRHSVARQRGAGYELFTFLGSRYAFEFAQPLRRGRWLLATSSRGDDSASVWSRLFASIGRRVFDVARPRLRGRRLLAASSRFGHDNTTPEGSSTWSTPGYGSEAIAVDDKRVAFMGSHQRRDRLFPCDIPSTDSDEAAVVECAVFRISDPDGRPMGAAKVAGRGSKLVFYLDGRLSELDIRDL